MSKVLNDTQIKQSVVYAVFDLTDRNGGSRKHFSLHMTPEGAEAVVAERRKWVDGRAAKSLIFFDELPVRE